MNNFIREKIKTYNDNINCQILSWEAEDEIEFSSDDNDNDNDKSKYVIHMFGVTEEGYSICIHIKDFNPYYFVKIPLHLQKKWGAMETEEIKRVLKQKMWKLKDSLISVTLIESKDISEFTNETNFKFLKIVTTSFKALKKTKYIFQPYNKNNGVYVQNIDNKKELKFEIFEFNIDPFIRFCHDKDIKLSGWVNVNNYINEDLSRCQIDISCKSKDICNYECKKISKIVIGSWDIETLSYRAKQTQKNIFPDPNQDNDMITQIGTTFERFGTKERIEHCCTIKSPLDNNEILVDNVIVEKFENEKDLILGWVELIEKTDTDMLIGYNTNGFDWMYLYTRTKKLNIDDTVLSNISRLINKEGKYEITQLNTNAAGENIFKYIKAPGILNCDLHTIIKREKKLESYKLNFVSSVYISDKKDDLDAMDIFNKCQDTSQNIAIVIKYCVKDTSLVLDLLKKLCILTNTIAMANVCWVPFDYIENKGQQIKVHSQLLYEAKLNNYKVPTVGYKETDDDFSFTGATVQEPKKGAYFQEITGLDFASLYPSIMIANNYSYETMVKSEKYKNIEGIEYKDIKWKEDEGTDKEREECVTFVQNKMGVLPKMLDKLWKERKAIKKEMKNVKKLLSSTSNQFEKDELHNQYDVLDGFQLAMKVSMNSIYGFTGARFGRMPEKKIAAAVCAEGRRMIQECKVHVESTYDCDVVYGDTDSIYVRFNSELPFGSIERRKYIFNISEKAANTCTKLFNKPVEMEFEKVMDPFVLYSKKRYACLIYTNIENYDYIDFKGIQVVRRDNCTLIKEKSKEIFNLILLDKNKDLAITKAREFTQNLLDGNIPIKELIISKSLKGRGSYEFDKQAICKKCGKRYYEEIVELGKIKKQYSISPLLEEENSRESKSVLVKKRMDKFLSVKHKCYTCYPKTPDEEKESWFIQNPPNIPHVALARKMEERDPYNCPEVGERVPFVFKKVNNSKALQAGRVEDPNYLIQNCIEIDYEYYFEHQWKSALETIFEPILGDELENILFKGIVAEKPPKKTRKKKE